MGAGNYTVLRMSRPWSPAAQPAGGGSVTFDQVSSVNLGAVATATWTHTPVGTPTAVGIAVQFELFAGLAPTSVTYGGGTADLEASDTGHVEMNQFGYSRPNPASGAQTVVVTFSATIVKGTVSAITVTGGSTSDAISNTVTNNGTTANPTATCTSATGELVMAFCSKNSTGTLTPDAPQDERWDLEEGSPGYDNNGATQAGAASVACNWTAAAQDWRVMAMSFKA